MNSVPINSRACSRSARKGEMKERVAVFREPLAPNTISVFMAQLREGPRPR